MKKIYPLIFIISLHFLFSEPLMAKPASSEVILKKKIETLLSGYDQTSTIGIMVQNARTGQEIYKKNPDLYFLPASSLKLFTAFVALHYLGANFKFETSLYADLQKIQEGILNDSIYFKFSGDPTLTFIQIDQLVSALSKAGIQEIKGDVLLDDTVFDRISMSPGTVWDDQDFCFGAPLGALILDRNCVVANLKPGMQPNQLAILELPKYPQFIPFTSGVMTRHSKPQTECVFEVKRPGDLNGYHVTGCMKMGSPAQRIEMAVLDPRAYFKQVLSYLFNQHHIRHLGEIKFQKADPLPTQLLATENSEPLHHLLSLMLKDSDNVVANALFKTLGARYFQKTGDWQNGKAALKAIFSKETQVSLAKARIVDGSGLSRYNYVTPRQVVTLLNKAFLAESFPFFLSALPVSGVDGTLKHRLNRSNALRKVHAKTGTMGGVTALSGYLETRKKQMLSFVIFINGFVEDPRKYKDLEDKVCALLIESA